MAEKTKMERVKELLLAGRRITALDALKEARSMRLAAIVHVLRRQGMEIVSEKVEVSKDTWVSAYWLKQKKQPTLFDKA